MKKHLSTKKLLFLLLAFFALALTACQQQKEKQKTTLPSSTALFQQIARQKINSCQSQWQEKNKQGKILQAVQIKYQQKPVVVYANFMTNANHFRMWISGKTNYIQMQGTASKRWFKTKLAKSSAYAQLTTNLTPTIIAACGQEAKIFKVKKISGGEELFYSGNKRKIWRSLRDNALLASVVGVDLDHVQPGKSTIILQTSSKGRLRKISVRSFYRDEGKNKQLQLQVGHFNQEGKLAVPRAVKQKAVNLGR